MLQPIERNLPQSTAGGNLGIEGGTGRGDPLSHELSAGIGVDLGAEHAVGVDGNAGGALPLLLLLLVPLRLCPNR